MTPLRLSEFSFNSFIQLVLNYTIGRDNLKLNGKSMKPNKNATDVDKYLNIQILETLHYHS